MSDICLRECSLFVVYDNSRVVCVPLTCASVIVVPPHPMANIPVSPMSLALSDMDSISPSRTCHGDAVCALGAKYLLE